MAYSTKPNVGQAFIQETWSPLKTVKRRADQAYIEETWSPHKPMKRSKDNRHSPEPEGLLRWHPIHRDPGDKVVIQSNDSVLFRASGYHLSQHCAFFDDMLSIVVENQEPITALPFDCETLSTFLDLIRVSNPSSLALSLALCERLLVLAKLLDAAELRETVLTKLHRMTEDHPIEILLTAARINQTGLAADALGSFRHLEQSRSRIRYT